MVKICLIKYPFLIFILFLFASFILKASTTNEYLYNLTDFFIVTIFFIIINFFLKINNKIVTFLLLISFLLFNFQGLNTFILLLTNKLKWFYFICIFFFIFLSYKKCNNIVLLFLLFSYSFVFFIFRYPNIVKEPCCTESISYNRNLKQSELPDIYVYLLDGYTSDKNLRYYFNYQNQLSQFLRNLNFNVTDSSTSVYNKTFPTFFSFFNLSLITNKNNSYFYLNQNNNQTTQDYLCDINLLKILKNSNYKLILDTYLFNNPNKFKFSFDKSFVMNFINGMSFSKYFIFDSTSFYNYENTNDKINPNLFYFKHFTFTHSPFVYTNYINYSNNHIDNMYISSIEYQNNVIKSAITKVLKQYERNKKPLQILIFGDHGSHIKNIEESKGNYLAYFSKNSINLNPKSSFDFSRNLVNKYFDSSINLSIKYQTLTSQYINR